MVARSRQKPSARSSLPARRVAAFSVHLLTASGAVIALLALFAAIEGKWTFMFALLALALIIDGIDGLLARRLKVAETLPRWSGDVLDLVVDYLTYVLVPAFAIATNPVVPEAFALPAAAAILISSAIYFADRQMKTADSYFRGFPALWNIVAFYLFLLRPDPYFALALVALFVALTFVPFYFVHPLRVRRFALLNTILLAIWSLFGMIALILDLRPPVLVTAGLVAIALYFLAVGLMRPARRG